MVANWVSEENKKLKLYSLIENSVADYIYVLIGKAAILNSQVSQGNRMQIQICQMVISFHSRLYTNNYSLNVAIRSNRNKMKKLLVKNKS